MGAADRLSRLSVLVSAAVRDIDVAISAWETVRPADQGEALLRHINHERIGTAFSVVRQALHTQILMALARLWDHGRSPIGFGKIASELASADVLSALIASAVASAERRLIETRDARTGELLSVADPILFQRRQDCLPEISANAERLVRVRVISWQSQYELYAQHKVRDGLDELRAVRDKRIAHWDIADVASGAERTYRLHRLGRILRASELLTEQALLLSKDEHLRFVNTHRLYAVEAKRYWARICPIADAK